MQNTTAVIVSAHDEAERLGATLAALREAFPGARIIVADDASTDGTADVAREAEVVTAPRRLGKGGAMTLAAQRIGDEPVIVLSDGDLGDSPATSPRSPTRSATAPARRLRRRLREQGEPTAGRHVKTTLPTGGRWDPERSEGILNLAIRQRRWFSPRLLLRRSSRRPVAT